MPPQIPEPLTDGGLPYVSLGMELKRPYPESIRYEVAGRPGEDAMSSERPVSPDRRIEGTFSFDASGAVSHPEEWKGYRCNVSFNQFGPHDDELTPDGFIGDGAWPINSQTIQIRLTLPAPIMRDLVALWGLLQESPTENINLRCDLVPLHEGAGTDSPRRYYRAIRIYC